MIINYVEVNAICIVFLLLLRFQLRNLDTTSWKQKILDVMMWSTILFCLSDMVAGIFRGMMFPGARIMIELSNTVYFELLVVISYLWFIYAYTSLSPNGVISRRAMTISALPAIAFTVIALLNPVVHFLFYIDSNNLYKRNVGIYLHWVVVWTYFLAPSAKALHAYLKETSVIKKQEIKPLLFFAIAPFIASVIQMLFYGVTTTQAGITVSIAMICLKSQESQVLTDALTGINNRRAMTSFAENQMQHNRDAQYTLVMIDVNHFKQINDKFGHMTGDLVLKATATALKEACKVFSNRAHISRFGGDEFVILGIDCAEDELKRMLDAIPTEINNIIDEQNIPCKISVSIGFAQRKCSQESDFRELLNEADQAMYTEKTGRVA